MPLLPGLRQILEIPVSDRVAGDTVIRQKARFVKLEHLQSPQGVCSVRVTVEVVMYAAVGDGIGPQLSGDGFFPRPVYLLADNNTVVDVATGAILAIREPAQAEEDWLAQCQSYAQPVMLQGDYFEYVRQHEPIRIADLIQLHMQQADTMGRYA